MLFRRDSIKNRIPNLDSKNRRIENRLVEALDKLEPIKNKIGNYNELVEKFWKIANEDYIEDDTEVVPFDVTADKGDHALDFIDNVALFFNVVEPIKNRIGNYNKVVEKFWKLVEIKTHGNGCWPNFAYINYAEQFIRSIEEFFNVVEPIKNRIGNYNEVLESFWKLVELETVDNTFDIDAPSLFIKKVLRQDFLTQKYGVELGEKLLNNKYFIGMTTEQLIESIGYPDTRTNLETKEIYIYRKLYEDNKVINLSNEPLFYEHKRDAFVFVNGELEQIKKDIHFYYSKESNSETIKGVADSKIAGVGIGWKTEADLDVSAFCLGADGHIVEKTDFVFFGSDTKQVLEGEDGPRPYSTDGAVYGAIDVLEGDEEEDGGDDEDMWIYFDGISDSIQEILVVVTIYDKGVTFNEVQGAYCRIWDQYSGKELCRYVMSEDFSNEDAVEIGKFTRYGVIEIDGDEYPAGEWSFTPTGKGHIGGLSKLISIYAHRYQFNVRKKKDF